MSGLLERCQIADQHIQNYGEQNSQRHSPQNHPSSDVIEKLLAPLVNVSIVLAPLFPERVERATMAV
jgi:hypothetical protein